MLENKERYVIGVDYGTDSVRAIIVNALTGEDMSTAVFAYPRWKEGLHCDSGKNQFRQHPQDYMDGLWHVLTECLNRCNESVRRNIKAISVDTTGSTPVAVDDKGIPLALQDRFRDDADAMFILWKDHSAANEAEAFNLHATKFDTNYLKYVGGRYSSEWYWSKLLHIVRKNPAIRDAASGWVEHCDWMHFVLTGGTHLNQLKRNVCTAGHKALWSHEWNGFPPLYFFSSLDPLLEKYAANLSSVTYTADKPAGLISPQWAEQLGLSKDVVIGIGAMDAHMGAVGGQIEPYFLSKVMGTSTCDMLVAPLAEMEGRYVEGICGLVNGSVIPGMVGMEAGQSAFGDVYAWFRNILTWPLLHLWKTQLDDHTIDALAHEILPALNAAAAQITPSLNNELSLDWFNGRRTPDANARLKSAMVGLGLGSDAVSMFHALVEGTCFGAKAIVDCFTSQQIPVKGVIGLGGVAQKSPFIMQTMADILEMPIRVNKAEQTCALGAAMFAATAAGIYPKVEVAMAHMGQGFEKTYVPNVQYVTVYKERYRRYKDLGIYMENSISEDR
ncbi:MULTISPECIES: ribulokinase [Chitinophagaceae]